MIARHFAANFVNFLIVIFLVIASLIYWAKNQYQDEGPLKSDISFEVKKGDIFRNVSADLAKQGIISNSVIFNVWARYAKQDENLKFGNYMISSKSSMSEVLALITSGKAINEQITFPEGFTSYQIVERLKSNLELEGEVGPLPTEGSLAPNTYSYQKGDTRRDILKKMAEMQKNIIKKFDEIITIEDHFYDGGFGSWIKECTNNTNIKTKIKSKYIDSNVINEVGSKEYLLKKFGPK